MMVTTSSPAANLDDPALPDARARVAAMEVVIGTCFHDQSLLLQALLHRSAVVERRRHGAAPPLLPSNERLEFLGDAVLAMLVARYVYDTFPDFSEGRLSEARAALVRRSTLAILAERLGLGDHLYMGQAERRAGSRGRTTVLAEAFEAVVAAIYLDQGLEAAWRLMSSLLEGQVPTLLARAGTLNPKSQAQSLAQARMRLLPSYRMLGRAGPAHDSRFTVEVLAGDLRAVGLGSSRQAAEQDAARHLLPALESLPDPAARAPEEGTALHAP
jgi:ribonuclease-3